MHALNCASPALNLNASSEAIRIIASATEGKVLGSPAPFGNMQARRRPGDGSSSLSAPLPEPPLESPIRRPAGSRPRYILRAIGLFSVAALLWLSSTRITKAPVPLQPHVIMERRKKGCSKDGQWRIEQQLGSSAETVEGAGFMRPGYMVWGGSVVHGHDDLHHMYASSWPAALGHGAWALSSEIVHAVSATGPLGPYAYVAPALARRGSTFWDGMATHNPHVHWVPALRVYALFYIGLTYDFPPPTPTAGLFADKQQCVSHSLTPLHYSQSASSFLCIECTSLDP